MLLMTFYFFVGELWFLAWLNQDSFCVHTSFNGDMEQHLFGVFDGQGDCGTHASQFARDKVCCWLDIVLLFVKFRMSSAHFSTSPTGLALYSSLTPRLCG
jgi:serine/threonine protein phosphatase PrpC